METRVCAAGGGGGGGGQGMSNMQAVHSVSVGPLPAPPPPPAKSLSLTHHICLKMVSAMWQFRGVHFLARGRCVLVRCAEVCLRSAVCWISGLQGLC